MLDKNVEFRLGKLIFVLAFFALSLLGLGILSPKVSAVEPGCYNSELVKLPPNECPSEGASKAVSQFGACYVDTEERNCEDLSQSGNAVPESRTFESEKLSSDDTLETDCEPDPPGTELNRKNCGIINLLVIGINVLSALAGMAIVFSIMFAGFQYMTARDNPGQTQQAKQRIVWAITALLLFIFMYALLDFLVPGGVL